MTLSIRAIQVIPLLKGLLFSYESLAEQKDIQLKFEAPESEIIIFVDRHLNLYIILIVLHPKTAITCSVNVQET